MHIASGKREVLIFSCCYSPTRNWLLRGCSKLVAMAVLAQCLLLSGLVGFAAALCALNGRFVDEHFLTYDVVQVGSKVTITPINGSWSATGDVSADPTWCGRGCVRAPLCS